MQATKPPPSTRLPTQIEQPAQQATIPVEATLRRTLTEFNVAIDKEVFEVDESSWEGKILARAVEGFFNEPKGIGMAGRPAVVGAKVGELGMLDDVLSEPDA